MGPRRPRNCLHPQCVRHDARERNLDREPQRQRRPPCRCAREPVPPSGAERVLHADMGAALTRLGTALDSRPGPARAAKLCMWCEDEPVMVREQRLDDYEAIRYVYAEAFRRPRFRPPQNPGSVPPEVGLFEALWEAGDVISELSFTALSDGGVVGHVTASDA